MKLRHCWILLALLLLPLAATSVSAQGLGFEGWGPRVGVQSDPDQGFVGAQFNFGEFAPRLRFQPNVELGFGDDPTIFSITVPVLYRFDVSPDITPYAGGGVVVLLDNHDPPGQKDDTDLEIGIRGYGGIEWPLRSGNAFFLEFSVGFSDIPDVQFLAGWNFGAGPQPTSQP